MAGFMLHGLGDCTPELNCGCIPRDPPPNTDWMEMECVCCGRREHLSWWRRLLRHGRKKEGG